jgi:hypothetical protein
MNKDTFKDTSDNEYIREADITFADRLIAAESLQQNFFLSETEKSKILEEIETEVLQYMMYEDDSLDDLVVKQDHLEKLVFPKLFNFKLHSKTYDNIYLEVLDRIETFKKAMEGDDDEPKGNEETKGDDAEPKSKEMQRNVRELRLAYYSKKSKKSM